MNETIVGWAPEPQSRGTMSLVGSCLATIFLCTWNAVHPNVPAKGDSAWRIFWRRVGYMLVALLAPEAVSWVALNECYLARTVQAKSPGWSLAQCFFLVMGGFAVQKGSEEPTHVGARDMLELLSTDAISWPDKSLESDILDRSKADWVLKSLAFVQATWFIANIIGRVAQGLPATTLELYTLGIVSCALFTYAASWAKPFSVCRSMTLSLRDGLPSNMWTSKRIHLLIDREDAVKDSPIPFVLTICIILVFGAIHLAGWQFHFPTELELWFWRASSVVCVVLPLCFMAVPLFEDPNSWIIQVLGGLYSLCRIYMLIEMLIALRALPVEVYRTPQWSMYIPSIS